MEKYNYLEAVTFDVKRWLLENYELESLLDPEDESALFSEIYENLFVTDEVTGNASGSYTMNRYEAEEYLCHNLSLLEDAANELGYSSIPFEWMEAETADVVIRCYLLNDAIAIAMEKIKNEALYV